MAAPTLVETPNIIQAYLRRLADFALFNGLVNYNTFTIRARFTIAEVNAGATIIPAPSISQKLRLTDAIMISIGGAAAAATTVDILATQAAASAKLLAVAVAALTQSAVVRAGAANATVLANGASFVANDANTAITIGKTGADITTATHIDVILNFSVDQA